MKDDALKMSDDVHIEVKPAKAAKKAAAAAPEAEAEAADDEALGLVVSIDEAAWTAQDADKPFLIIDRPEEWPTQDYVNHPPAHVEFTHPVPESI